MTHARKRLLGVACLALVTAVPAHGQVVRQLTDTHSSSVNGLRYVVDDAGDWVYLVASTEEFGDNPVAAYQLFRVSTTTGQGARVSDIDGGIAAASVSDDGQWIAFTSRGDPKGQNQDRSEELFVMQSNGTRVVQLTNLASDAEGRIFYPVICGDGSRILFLSDADLGGLNPERRSELWRIQRDGSGLVRVTHMQSGVITSPLIAISDDGTRIVFESNADPLGQNPDGGREIFAVNGDGTDLRQLSSGTKWSESPHISGDGGTVVFQSQEDLAPPGNPLGLRTIYAMNWDGSGLKQLTNGMHGGQWPVVTDDGQTVVFVGTGFHDASQNPDGGAELWSIHRDGTGLLALTDTPVETTFLVPDVAGSGARVLGTYQNAVPAWGDDPDGSGEWFAVAGDGSNPVQLMHAVELYSRTPDVTADGSRIVFAANGTREGSTPDYQSRIYSIAGNGSDLRVLTPFAGRSGKPGISDDGGLVVFESDGDPLGENPDGSLEVFVVQADGTGLRQLTKAGTQGAEQPAISADGRRVAFVSAADLDGAEGPSNTGDVFVIDLGTGQPTRVTFGSANSLEPHIDPRLNRDGTWVVFASTEDYLGSNGDGGAEIYRARTDGSLIEQLTDGDGETWTRHPDISGDGRFVVYVSDTDPLGLNPERNREVFLIDTTDGTTRQLTQTASGYASTPAISDDGAWVYFVSSAELVGTPGGSADVYRCAVASGSIERVSAVHLYSTLTDRPAVSADGAVAAWAKLGDETDTNADLNWELFINVPAKPPRLFITGRSQGGIRWDPKQGAFSYDSIRGDVENLRFVNGVVDLGPVHCLEEDSPDLDVEIHHDQEDPDPFPGRIVFYINRPDMGDILGVETWGTASDGSPREPGAGTCQP
ncbi:MAG: hypothetical protein Kow0062_09750 [Acidobacteriota bacterium]